MSDRILALPAPQPPGRLIVIETRDLVQHLKEDLAHINDTSYNLNEVGAVLVEALDVAMMANADRVAEMRAGFSEHFSRAYSTTEQEYPYLTEKLDHFFEGVASRVNAIHLEELGKNGHLGISFHQWSGEDLVIHHHPLPY